MEGLPILQVLIIETLFAELLFKCKHGKGGRLHMTITSLTIEIIGCFKKENVGIQKELLNSVVLV